MRRAGIYASLAVFLGLAGLPLVSQGYHLELLTVIFFWSGLAGAWNLMSGQTGYIDFGSAAYVGVGSYLAGILMLKGGLGLVPSVALAGVGCLGLALLVGGPTLRLKGAYFAIASFALAEALLQVCLEWKALTEGGLGLTLNARLSDLGYYWIYLVLGGLVIAIRWLMGFTRLGYALRALRQDEAAALGLGVNASAVKLCVYCLSAVFIGILGALDASRLGYFTPGDVFNVHITIKMVVMCLLGGLGTVLGPVVGAAFLQVIEDVLGAQFLHIYLFIVGVVIVAVIVFLPRGILGGVLFRRRRL